MTLTVSNGSTVGSGPNVLNAPTVSSTVNPKAGAAEISDVVQAQTESQTLSGPEHPSSPNSKTTSPTPVSDSEPDPGSTHGDILSTVLFGPDPETRIFISRGSVGLRGVPPPAWIFDTRSLKIPGVTLTGRPTFRFRF